MESIKVSAVISVYNGEKFLNNCIESLLKQSYSFYEIVIYDDKSSDKTSKIIKNYQKKYPTIIKSHISKINRGPGGGKTKAMELATGKYILFIDADDYLDNYYVEELVKTIREFQVKEGKENYPDIIFSGFKQVDESGKTLYIRNFKSVPEALHGAISNWGKLFLKEFLEKNEIKIPKGKVLDDVLTKAIIVAFNPKCTLCKENIGYNYVKNINSVSNTYMKKFINGVADLEMEYLYKNKNKIEERNRSIYIYYVYKIFCWHLLKSGAGVGKEEMKLEWKQIYTKLNEYFPEYKTNIYLTGKNKVIGERKIVSFVIYVMFFLEKIHLQIFFLELYASFNFGFLWPKM